MAPMAIVSCGEAHRPERPIGGDLVVRLLGCGVGDSTTELIFSVRRASDAYKIIWSRFIWQPPLALALQVSIGGRACAVPRGLVHAVRIQCPGSNAGASSIQISVRSRPSNATSSGNPDGGASWRVPLVRRPLDGAREAVVCSGTAIWGSLDAQLAMLARSRAAWAAAGVATSMVFARDASSCNALERLPGVACDVRPAWGATLDVATTGWKSVDIDFVRRYFDQPLNQQLCLSYARAASIDFVIFADTDDFAPPTEDLILVQRRAREASLAGVKLFFDADGACPPFFCPKSPGDWQDRRPNATNDMALNHWKPLVAANRAADVSAHDFTPETPFERKQAWGRACLRHRNSEQRAVGAAPLAASRPRLMLTRPKWLVRKGHNGSISPPRQSCAENDEWCKLVRGRRS